MRERALLTFGLWLLLLGALVAGIGIMAVFIEDWVILVYSVLVLSAGVGSTGFIWSWGNLRTVEVASQAQQEKGKRDKLDLMLQDLSDTQLARLRDRLASGEITDDYLERLLSDESDKQKRRA